MLPTLKCDRFLLKFNFTETDVSIWIRTYYYVCCCAYGTSFLFTIKQITVGLLWLLSHSHCNKKTGKPIELKHNTIICIKNIDKVTSFNVNVYELQFLISDTYWNLQEENICDRKGHFKKDYQNIESFVTETQQTSKLKKNVKKCLSEASFSVDAILQSDRSQFPPRRWKKLVSKWRRKPSSNILTGITHPIEVGMREVSSRAGLPFGL